VRPVESAVRVSPRLRLDAWPRQEAIEIGRELASVALVAAPAPRPQPMKLMVTTKRRRSGPFVDAGVTMEGETGGDLLRKFVAESIAGGDKRYWQLIIQRTPKRSVSMPKAEDQKVLSMGSSIEPSSARAAKIAWARAASSSETIRLMLDLEA
jgi:hypothetical protein